jgi:uncharacterized protein (DUF2235 family)
VDVADTIQNTNVVKFFSLLKKDDPEKQLVYYQAGIGTYTNPGMWNHFVAEVSKMADLAVAWYLEAHVISAYSYLMKVVLRLRLCLG